MHKIFSYLDSDRLEIKYYGPFPRKLNDILSRFKLYTVINSTDKIASIFVNGEEIETDTTIEAPALIEIFLGSPRDEGQRPCILWEDNEIAVVFKPSYMATQPTRLRKEKNLRDELSKILPEGFHIPSRLDFGVCGLILISKTPKVHKHVHNLYAKRKIKKFYALLSDQHVNWRYYYIRSNIVRSPTHSAIRESAVGEGAETLFTYIGRSRGLNLYVARPFTGKTHQIRVHARSLGIPIHGDPFYSEPKPGGIKLACFCLIFEFRGREFKTVIPKSLAPEWLDLDILYSTENLWLT